MDAMLAEPVELPFQTSAAVCLPEQMQINPAQYLAALHGSLTELGVPVGMAGADRVDHQDKRAAASHVDARHGRERRLGRRRDAAFPLRTLMFATTKPARSYALAARVDGDLPQGHVPVRRLPDPLLRAPPLRKRARSSSCSAATDTPLDAEIRRAGT